MMKFLGSAIALGVGAGALYYWWTHEKGEGDLHTMVHHTEDTLHDAGRDLRKAAEDV